MKMKMRVLFAMVALVAMSVYPLYAYGDDLADKIEAEDNARTLVEAVVNSEDPYAKYAIPHVDIAHFSLGEPVLGYELTENDVLYAHTKYWPLYCGSDLVATIRAVEDSEGYTTFTFTTAYANAFESFLGDHSSCAALLDEDVKYLVSPETVISFEALSDVDGNETPAMEAAESPALSADALSKIEFSSGQSYSNVISVEGSDHGKSVDPVLVTSDAEQSQASESRASEFDNQARSISANLKVPSVNQGQKPICWAASVSSIGWYLTGKFLVPDHISNTIKGGLTGGTDEDAIKGLAMYVYPSSNTALVGRQKTGIMSDQEVLNWLSNGLPVYAHVAVSGTSNHHAVVACGWSRDANGRLSVTVMNPGHGLYEEMSKNGSGIFDLKYNSSDYLWNYSSVVLPGWLKPYGGGSWSYFSPDGRKATGWWKVGEGWYYFDANGNMLTGWQNIGGTWYYLAESGQMATGWINLGGTWYYLDSTGAMLANQWFQQGGEWYYLNASGAALTGWQAIDGHWYAFDANCKMRRGWFLDGGTWYYLRTAGNVPSGGPEGSMLSNGSWYIGSKTYSFDSSGRCLNP